MAKYVETRIKANACGICPDLKRDIDTLDFLHFIKEVIFPYPKMNEYSSILYAYGKYQKEQYDYIQSIKGLEKFEKEDKDYELWMKLCQQIKFFMEKESIDIFYVGKNESKKNKLESFDKSLDETILKILIDDLCAFENSLQKDDFTKPSDISLLTINERIENGLKENLKCSGVQRGKPLTSTMLLNHICIQSLSFLLRIDTLFENATKNSSIDEIKMTNTDYRFIYDFLKFFKILDYELNEHNTTMGEDLIKQRFKNPPLKSYPFLNDMLRMCKDVIYQRIYSLE
ncbi:MAG: hypothetical protein ACK5KL_09055 [Dysgonomonas sp.]